MSKEHNMVTGEKIMANKERVLWWLSILAVLIVSASITIPTITAIAESKNLPLKTGK
jgi:hypothetical protein